MNPRILVVDDDQDHAESVADLLSMRGYAVDVAFTGEEAIERFREVHYDVTLMDVRMPGINGVEAFFQCRKIRPGAQIIMMTGLSVEQLLAQALEGGAVAVLHKPLAMSHLLNEVKKVHMRGLVVVADNDEAFVDNASKVLAENGYRVSVARSVEDVGAHLTSGATDCLILDLRMPLLSAVEAYVQGRPADCAVAAILVADCNVEKEEAAKWLASEQILIKPCDPSLLLAAVKHALASCHVAKAA